MCEIEYSFIWFQREKESRVDSAIEQSINFVDARNGFNELIRKALFWTVRHRWSASTATDTRRP